MGTENAGGHMPQRENQNFLRKKPEFYSNVSETQRNAHVKPGDSQSGFSQEWRAFLNLPQEVREKMAADYLKQFIDEQEGSDYGGKQETVYQAVNRASFEEQGPTQETFTGHEQAAYEVFQRERIEESTAESPEYGVGLGDRPDEHRKQPEVVRRSGFGAAAEWVENKLEDAKDLITKPMPPMLTEHKEKLDNKHDKIKKRNARRKHARKGKSPNQLMERGGIELGTGVTMGTFDALEIMTHTVISSSPAVTTLEEVGFGLLAAGFIALGARNVVNGVVDKLTEWRQPRIENKLKKDEQRRDRHNDYLLRQHEKYRRRRSR